MYFYSLKGGFGLLKEEGETSSFVSLVFLDLSLGSLHKFHTVEYPTIDIEIVVNKADPTTFILTHYINNEQSSRIFKIVEKKIIIEDVIEIDFSPDCFYDKYVYATEWIDDEGEEIDVRILKMFKGG
jgi:hypothetical protein